MPHVYVYLFILFENLAIFLNWYLQTKGAAVPYRERTFLSNLFNDIFIIAQTTTFKTSYQLDYIHFQQTSILSNRQHCISFHFVVFMVCV